MSPVYGPREDRDWADTTRVTLSSGVMFDHDSLILDPKDRSPNRNWRDIGPRGEPIGWSIDLPVSRRGQNIYVSRPGLRASGPGVPQEETEPPRRDTLTKQNFVPIPFNKYWIKFKNTEYGWLYEGRTERQSRLPRPASAPTASVAVGTRKGFLAGVYGVVIDFRPPDGSRTGSRGVGGRGADNRTLPSGMSLVTIAQDGQGIRVYIPPEAFSSGAAYMGVYVTRPGTSGQRGTERLQEVFDIRHADARGYVVVDGPHHDNNIRPTTVDQSGVGRPPAPLFRRKSGRAYISEGRARFMLNKGSYRFGYQVVDRRGISPVSFMTPFKDQPTNEYRHAFWFRFPGLPDDWRIIPVFYRQPIGGGTGSWFRVYRDLSPEGEEHAYDDRWMDNGVPIYGQSSSLVKPPLTKAQKRRREARNKRGEAGQGERSAIDDYDRTGDAPRIHAEIDVGATGPLEDTTIIPSPDPDSGPDVLPEGSGALTVGKYLVATTDEDTLGNESPLSATDVVTTTLGQGVRVLASPPVNHLPNAEGAHRGGDAAQTVFAWSGMSANATSTANWKDGSLILTGQGAGTSIAPTCDPINLPQDAPVSIKAQIRIGRVSANVATELAVRWLNDALATLSETVVLKSQVVGKIDLGELGSTLNPPNQATKMQLVFRGTAGGWDSLALLENLGVFFLPSGIRKIEEVGNDQPVIFNPTASADKTKAGVATPYPYGSIHGVGPVEAAEEAAPNAEPLLDIVNFESGSWPGAWSTSPFTNDTGIEAVGPSNSIFGNNSVEHQDGTAVVPKRFLRRRTFNDAGIGGAGVVDLCVRWFDANPVRPSTGKVMRTRVNDASGVAMASVYQTPGQIHLYSHDSAGDRSTYQVAVSGLSNNVSTDLELQVLNGNSTDGRIVITAGTNGNGRRQVASFGGRDWTGRKPRQIDFGIEEITAASTYTFRADNILISRNGAPLNYENLPMSTGTTIPATPPGPDAPPLAGGGHRLYDSLNAPLNQWFFWIEPGVRRSEEQEYGPYCEEPINVKPGETITHAVQGGWKMHETPEEASHQFFVTLYGPGKDPLRVGSPFAKGRDWTTVSRVGGSRSDRAAVGGMAQTGAIDNATDFYQTFVVPAGYIWATITPRYGAAGYYVFQEHLFASGSLTTQSARDAARDYGRATSGSATVIFRATPQDNPYFWPYGDGRLDLGLDEGHLGLNASISNVLWSSAATPAGTYSTPTAITANVPENSFYKVSFDMAGESSLNGDYPIIEPGSIYAIVKPFTSQLLKSDRTEISGGIAFVNGSDTASRRPRTEVMELDGDIFAPARSRTVHYATGPLEIHIGSENQKRYLESLQPDDFLAIENPFIGGDGVVQIIRPGQEINVDTSLTTAFIDGQNRKVYGVTTINAFQVVEEAPLLDQP